MTDFSEDCKNNLKIKKIPRYFEFLFETLIKDDEDFIHSHRADLQNDCDKSDPMLDSGEIE